LQLYGRARALLGHRRQGLLDEHVGHGIRNLRRTPVRTPGAAVMDRSCGS